jgi:HlyD family secretion protein
MDRPVAATLRPSARTIAIAAAVILLLAGAVAFPSIRRWVRAERSIDGTTVRVARVTRGDLLRDISVQARVVAAQHPTLTSPAQGTVALKTKAGSPIRRGEVLAVIDSVELHSALSQARSLLLATRSELERQKLLSRQALLRDAQQVELMTLRLEAAKRNLQRYETTFREGLSNKTDYEAAQDAVRIAAMELEQSKRELELDRETTTFDVHSREQQVRMQEAAAAELQRKVDELTVRAPFDGIVASVAVEDGNAVGPNQPVLTVVNLSALELEIALPEEYGNETAIGTPASIHYAGRDYEGAVTAISPEVVNSQLAAVVSFRGQTPAGLKQNQRVTTRLVFESKKNVLKAPRGTFLEAGGGRSVYVVDGKLAHRRAIETGATSVGEVEIVRGLREGDVIVISDTTAFQGAQSVLLR